VGQSLGAFAASLVAARLEVAELVLVAPMIPVPGETAGDWWAAVEHDEAIAPLIRRLGDMGTWGPEELASGLPTVGLGQGVFRVETAAVAAGVLLCALRAGIVTPGANGA